MPRPVLEKFLGQDVFLEMDLPEKLRKQSTGQVDPYLCRFYVLRKDYCYPIDFRYGR